jgi:hypothetical protein
MFERIRFARYALRFERAFRNDDWEPVKECFHPDARYIIAGTDSAYDGETRGAGAIMDLFRRMLNDWDRKLDKRSPRITSWPRVRGGELDFRWSVRYTSRGDSVVITGRSQCRFEGGKIIELRDTMLPEECARFIAMAARA